MKKIAALVFLFSVSKTILSQTGPDQIPPKLYKAMFDPPTYRANLIQCASTTSTTCNNVNNNTFTHSSSYDPTFPDHFQDPFEAPPGFLVPEWAATHGTPQITDNYNTAPPTLPSGTTGYAFMVTSPSADPLEPGRHEGITQKITPLTAGKKYILSFFSRVQNITYNNHYLEEFNIKLMNCYDVSNITQPAFPRSFNIPNFDAYPHQNLICQTSNINTTWQQYTITFIASANFDAIVMYPRNTIVSPFSNYIGVLLAYPQLFEVSNFTAGPIPNPTPGNCTVTIGPTTPNCSVANALYTWTSPNGTSFPANTLQQIQVDAGIQQNVGIWKLSMTVPNAITPNGGCSQPPVVVATVNVPACQNCTPPIVTPAGPIDYYIPVDFDATKLKLTSNITIGNQWYYNNQPISGATNQEYSFTSSSNSFGLYYTKVNGCVSNVVSVSFKHYGYGLYGEENWGNFGAKMLPTGTSSFFCLNTSNNLIKQFDQGTAANYSWEVINLPGYGLPYLSITPGSSNLHSNIAAVDFGSSVAIQNLVPGFGYNLIQGISDLNGIQKIIDYVFYTTPFNSGTWYTCSNTILNINATQNYWGPVLPGRTLFDWEDYDFGPNSTILQPNPSSYPDPTDPNNIHKLHIPGRNAFTGSIQVQYSGPSTLHKSFYYNSPIGGCYKEDMNILPFSPGCFQQLTNLDKSEKKVLSSIYPNPTSNYITITSKESINYIEISDLMNPALKRIKVNNTKSVTANVSDLKPGIYNCRITTAKGTENQKLIINR